MPTSTIPAKLPTTADVVAATIPPPAADWNLATFSSITAAQEMLDSLEAQGVVEREFVVIDKSSFGVRWR